MLELPKSTQYNKRIPKQKFYENIDISPALKMVFTKQVKTVYWKNKIASTTTNLAKGNIVNEIEVFEIKLNSQNIDDSLFKQIDRQIPYHILFLIEYEGKYQAWIGYKEASEAGKNAFKVNGYYHTKWLEEDDLPLKLEGLNIDLAYENFVRQIAGNRLKAEDGGESLKESVEKDEKRKQLEKEIASLKSKIRKEKQFNKQMKLNSELKKLKRELEGM